MKRSCFIFPTSRSARQFIINNQDGFLPYIYSIEEFLQRSFIEKGKIFPDDELRLLALHKASNFREFIHLNIDRNFFSFIQNSEYIFKFFEEISTEQVSIDTLECADTYGEYEEHITILKTLLNRYKTIVEEKGWSDPIFSKFQSELNTSFVERFSEITIYVEGYLSRYELNLLKRIASHTNLICIFECCEYNQKMKNRFEEIFGALDIGNEYTLNLSTQEVHSHKKIQNIHHVVCESVPNRLSQIGFIKASIQEFVDGGIAPENIAIVLPDRTFSRYMNALNKEKNFSFAMGTSMIYSESILAYEAVIKFFDEPSIENTLRLKRFNQEWIDWIKLHYNDLYTNFLFEEYISKMLKFDTRESVQEIIQNEAKKMLSFSNEFDNLELKSVIKLFINRLKKINIDDLYGGKVTVMSVLDTRGMHFDGVVVVDFNEGFVPHKSQKDLFLNSKVRFAAGLPTTLDRESLQKHYYDRLFKRAKHVRISTVENAESIPSRFLVQLGIRYETSNVNYDEITLGPCQWNRVDDAEIGTEFVFSDHPISASSLKSLLTCKRQFYYKYIAKIKEHQQPVDLFVERDIGNYLHKVLEQVYKNTNYPTTKQMIAQSINSHLEEQLGNELMEQYVHGYWKYKIDKFAENEAQRFENGYRVYSTEQDLKVKIMGLTLVGRIDRIDVFHDKYEIIDYKSGHYPDTSKEPSENDVDFQLPIYALLASSFGEINQCGYYDLNSGDIKYDHYLDDRIEQLKNILILLNNETYWKWEKCEHLSSCRFCPYVLLCGRELE